jgi:hypothetical protein
VLVPKSNQMVQAESDVQDAQAAAERNRRRLLRLKDGAQESGGQGHVPKAISRCHPAERRLVQADRQLHYVRPNLAPKATDIPVTLKITDGNALSIHTAGRVLVGNPATIVVTPCRIIPFEDKCYGTRAIDYKKRGTITGTTTRVSIPTILDGTGR